MDKLNTRKSKSELKIKTNILSRGSISYEDNHETFLNL